MRGLASIKAFLMRTAPAFSSAARCRLKFPSVSRQRSFSSANERPSAAAASSGTVLSVADDDKRAVILPAHRLQELGFRLTATEGTAEILARNGIRVDVVSKYSDTQESGERNVVDLINAGEIDIVVNTPSGGIARADGYEIRAAAVAADKALFTTMAVLGAAVSALPVLREGFDVKSLQEYAQDRAERLAEVGR